MFFKRAVLSFALFVSGCATHSPDYTYLNSTFQWRVGQYIVSLASEATPELLQASLERMGSKAKVIPLHNDSKYPLARRADKSITPPPEGPWWISHKFVIIRGADRATASLLKNDPLVTAISPHVYGCDALSE